MKKPKLFRFWTEGKSPTIDNAVGGFIGGLVLAFLGWLVSKYSALTESVASLSIGLRSSESVLNGELWAYRVGTFSMLVYILAVEYSKRKLPPKKRYRTDEFFGLIWRWSPSNNDKDEEVYSLEAYCPLDDTKIVWRSHYHDSFGMCTHCKFRTAAAEGLEGALRHERVPLSIGRNLRNGQWKNAKVRIAKLREEKLADAEREKDWTLEKQKSGQR